MSKQSKAKARLRKGRFQKPSLPRVIGANDNQPQAVNDNAAPVTIRGVRLTDGQGYRFAQAQEQIASDRLDTQRAGHRTMEALDREIDARSTGAAVEAALEERRGLEALRGYEIGKSKIEGAVGAPHLSRDGLETLLTAKSITKTQHAAGMLYRADYERIDPEKMLTPPQLDPEKLNVVRGGDGWDHKRREIEERVFGIHLMICGVDAPTATERRALPRLPAGHPAMRAIHALVEIAGKGANLGDMTASGSVKARIREDLIFALEACAITYGLE
jgi:hypothetical protein